VRKYTANYARTNSNFIIQNIDTTPLNSKLLPILYVLKNILQRGVPTSMSKYLQNKIGAIHTFENFGKNTDAKHRLFFITNELSVWHNTIKGSEEQNYFPAQEFHEKIIPNEFGEYAFVQSLLLPEVEINEITGIDNEDFVHQQVDFYLPIAKLVIEIDGSQHQDDEVTKKLDKERDDYLRTKGITCIRISTKELQNETYSEKINDILNHLRLYENKGLGHYRATYNKVCNNQFSEVEVKTKLLPSAIIRFQILLLELLIAGKLTLDKSWNFNILSHEELPDFAHLATTDLLIWLDHLWQLKNKEKLKKPTISIKITSDKTKFVPTTNEINIDFSLLKRYTDEDIVCPDVIFVRTDYFDDIKKYNYFKVSTTDPIQYNIIQDDETTLEFFLENIFDKPHFRSGQFPIISNILNRNDTIGILPTGGGKSLCFQLPCLLQPCINFVVCPIKSLMKDQVDNLKEIQLTNISFVSSYLDAHEKENELANFSHGRYLLLWISPERFQNLQFREKFTNVVANFSISYAVIDEVHCISEWGHDFRTSYLNLVKTIDKLSPKDENGQGAIKFVGLTATASLNVLKDIKVEFSRQKTELEEHNIKSLLDYSRKELYFEVVKEENNKMKLLKEMLKELNKKEGLFKDDSTKAALIFTPFINGTYGCYHVAHTLSTIYPNKVKWFSGSKPKSVQTTDKDFESYKQGIQTAFRANKFPLLVATKAFGMGINKTNIHYTFHYGLPSSVEGLYQEAGRAGRWDKRQEENKNKVAKCYILHTPEVYDQKIVELFFQKDASFSEMQKSYKDIGLNRKDVFRQVGLFLLEQHDIQDDFETILKVVEICFRPETKVKIFWEKTKDNEGNNVSSEVNKQGTSSGSIPKNVSVHVDKEHGWLATIDLDKARLEKCIYRLSLLGLVSDWTTNFYNHFEVEFNSDKDEHILSNLENYIYKYDPTTNVRQKVDAVDKKTVLEKAIWYLLNWIFETIIYTRKQSLKNMSDWCTEYKNSVSFKAKIDNYFQFNETTFILQHISEQPKDYLKWIEILLDKTNRGQLMTTREFQKLQDTISRFLESYRNNIGLNFVSGFVRLKLNNYEDADGRIRFESALAMIKELLSKKEIDDLLTRLKELGKHLTKKQKENLCVSVSTHYPERRVEYAEEYELDYLLEDIYREKIENLKHIKNKLHEQLAEI